ncbi:alpha/beta fold hydrolase [Arthrobacter sp. ISL-95]|uniref:alpha/beta fold hydrolase n=1 Tax=Arthrobacter sp. ISL-95 TaxID=2819116 RepID=UPI001BE87DF4|nr:alpha/beta hydrolase [Arthrobacter sp. ISL-95]MBT2587658.1 alpha/beta fold hydrolase [Arthrobacter sp. ISL-95]
MNQTISSDGTTIAVDSYGNGPALVVVVGAFCDRQSKKGLTARLSDRFTIFEYDRRGRGDSGPLGDNSVEREVDDLAAVISLTGQSPFVFGDSSGGALALAAAAAGVAMKRIAVFEVPFTEGPSFTVAQELARLVASGQPGEAVVRFLALMGTPAPAVEAMRQGPYWPHMEAFAATLPIDVQLCNNGVIPRGQLGTLTAPLLALAGDRSPWAEDVARTIAAAAPGAEARVLSGVGHDVPDAVLAPILAEYFA